VVYWLHIHDNAVEGHCCGPPYATITVYNIELPIWLTAPAVMF